MTDNIIRGELPDDNYTVLRNEVLNDVRLSFLALGILVHLISKPPKWKTSITALQHQRKEGREALRGAIKQLEKCGYMKKELVQDKDSGKLQGYRYYVYHKPIDGFPPDGSPPVGMPSAYKEQIDKKHIHKDTLVSTSYLHSHLSQDDDPCMPPRFTSDKDSQNPVKQERAMPSPVDQETKQQKAAGKVKSEDPTVAADGAAHKETGRYIHPTGLMSQAQEVYDHMNGLWGTKFRLKKPNGKPTSNSKFLLDRLRDGYTLDELKDVVSMKDEEWFHEPEAGKIDTRAWLKPNTLFRASNFENYLGKLPEWRRKNEQRNVRRD